MRPTRLVFALLILLAPMAVGAQYKIVTPYFAMISHQRPLCGVSGVPSYMTDVTPLESGP